MDLFVQLRKMKILLIDDDEWIRDSLTLFFESEQCQLKALETAEEGLNALRHQRYDIIISDYWLPGMNGLDFFKCIKNSNKNAIKILITAYGSPGVVDEARKAGVHSLIAKPFTSDTVEAVLSRLITDRKGQGSDPDEEEME
jgi:DNA-binding NtrC family response regulator